MVATSSAQVAMESLQVGPASDRAGDVRTPPSGIPLKAVQAVRRPEFKRKQGGGFAAKRAVTEDNKANSVLEGFPHILVNGR